MVALDGDQQMTTYFILSGDVSSYLYVHEGRQRNLYLYFGVYLATFSL